MAGSEAVGAERFEATGNGQHAIAEKQQKAVTHPAALDFHIHLQTRCLNPTSYFLTGEFHAQHGGR